MGDSNPAHPAMARPPTRGLRWNMVTRNIASIRILPKEDRVEIMLQPGFTRTELDVVRALPGWSYDGGRRIVSRVVVVTSSGTPFISVVTSPRPDVHHDDDLPVRGRRTHDSNSSHKI